MDLAVTVLIWTLVPLAPIAGLAFISWLISLQQLNKRRKDAIWPEYENLRQK